MEPLPRGPRASESARARNCCCHRARHGDRPPPRDQSKARGPPGTCGAHSSPMLGRLCLPAPASTTVLQHTRGVDDTGASRCPSPEGAFWGHPCWNQGPGLIPAACWEWATLVRCRDRGGHTAAAARQGQRTLSPQPGHSQAGPLCTWPEPRSVSPQLRGHPARWTHKSGQVPRWRCHQGLARGAGCPGLGGSVSPARPPTPGASNSVLI